MAGTSRRRELVVQDRAGYREHVRAVVAASAAPYGYTLTLWTAGAVTAHAEAGLPTALDAVLLLAGAVVGFGAVGTYASGGINAVLVPGSPGRVRVWGGMHLPSVGLSILLVVSINALLDGPVVWPLVGFTATTCYLLVIGAQFWVATHRGEEPTTTGALATQQTPEVDEDENPRTDPGAAQLP